MIWGIIPKINIFLFLTKKILVLYNKILFSREMITAGQIRAARGMLKMNAQELAEESGLNAATISRIEKDDIELEKAGITTIKKIKTALELKGIRFLKPKEEGFIDGVGIRYFPSEIKEAEKK